MGKDLYPTLVELAKLGASGFGVAFLLVGLLLLVRSKPLDAQSAKLQGKFLLYGLILAIALLLIPPLFQKTGGPISERLSFSPDLATEKLPPPTVRLPDGTVTQDDAKFDLQPGTGTQVVTIAMDGTLDQVRNLRQASATLSSAVTAVTQQRDALAVQAAAAKPAPDGQAATAAAPALQVLHQDSATTGAIQNDVARSLSVGDYARVNRLSGQIHNSVLTADRAVAVITKEGSAPSH